MAQVQARWPLAVPAACAGACSRKGPAALAKGTARPSGGEDVGAETSDSMKLHQALAMLTALASNRWAAAVAVALAMAAMPRWANLRLPHWKMLAVQRTGFRLATKRGAREEALHAAASPARRVLHPTEQVGLTRHDAGWNCCA